jgi:hypothetical protein
MTWEICDKCKKKRSVYKLGKDSRHHLCSHCMTEWKKFWRKEPYNGKLDFAYNKPEWLQVWESVFQTFLGKELVQFT